MGCRQGLLINAITSLAQQYPGPLHDMLQMPSVVILAIKTGNCIDQQFLIKASKT